MVNHKSIIVFVVFLGLKKQKTHEDLKNILRNSGLICTLLSIHKLLLLTTNKHLYTFNKEIILQH